MWSRGNGLQPGTAFDAAMPEKALVALLKHGIDVRGNDIFVPGCGRGYSLAAFVEAGCKSATGLEISPTAAAAANTYLSKARISEGSARVIEGDFFCYQGGPYDIVYDCTFLCAIQPHERSNWAAQMASLVKPGGELITLIFPTRADGEPDPADPANTGGGPPFMISPKLVEKLVLPAGFTKVSCERVPSDLVTRKFSAGEWIARWRKT